MSLGFRSRREVIHFFFCPCPLSVVRSAYLCVKFKFSVTKITIDSDNFVGKCSGMLLYYVPFSCLSGTLKSYVLYFMWHMFGQVCVEYNLLVVWYKSVLRCVWNVVTRN